MKKFEEKSIDEKLNSINNKVSAILTIIAVDLDIEKDFLIELLEK